MVVQAAWKLEPSLTDDPVLAALDAAPLAREPLSEEEQASLSEALADVRAGRVRMLSHEEFVGGAQLGATE